MTHNWLTIRQCVELIRSQDPDGKGISRWQLRRRLESWNTRSGGRLLRWVSKPGGKREVNAAILRQMLRTDPLDRELELSEVHERIDVLDGRTKAMRGRLTKHGRRLDGHDDDLVSHRKALEHLHASMAELLTGGARKSHS